jgi:hypothetical protein
MNLHSIVRGAINTVNPDITGRWLESTNAVTYTPDGRPVPAYTHHAGVRMQVQALTGKDLQHVNFASMQGVKRSVYAFSNIQGVVRPDGTGGDLLIFPQDRGGAERVWLVVAVLETWTPDSAGWCKVGVVLQPDAVPPP